jgi:hypothetical protein
VSIGLSLAVCISYYYYNIKRPLQAIIQCWTNHVRTLDNSGGKAVTFIDQAYDNLKEDYTSVGIVARLWAG